MFLFARVGTHEQPRARVPPTSARHTNAFAYPRLKRAQVAIAAVHRPSRSMENIHARSGQRPPQIRGVWGRRLSAPELRATCAHNGLGSPHGARAAAALRARAAPHLGIQRRHHSSAGLRRSPSQTARPATSAIQQPVPARVKEASIGAHVPPCPLPPPAIVDRGYPPQCVLWPSLPTGTPVTLVARPPTSYELRGSLQGWMAFAGMSAEAHANMARQLVNPLASKTRSKERALPRRAAGIAEKTRQSVGGPTQAERAISGLKVMPNDKKPDVARLWCASPRCL